mgnify:CR=1 FL=1
MYSTEEGFVSEEEIAEIIFNSADFVLDDMLAKCTEVGFSIYGLIARLASDINAAYERDLAANTTTAARREFLEARIRIELMFYVQHPELGDKKLS